MKYFFFFTRLLIQMRLKFWHRLPWQMPIRCYLLEGQSQTFLRQSELIILSEIVSDSNEIKMLA